MIKYKLEDISLVVGGGTPPTTNERNYDGDIVWITPKDLSDQNEKFIERGQRSITLEGFNACSAQMIPPYNILMSSRAPIGLLAINRYECCTNQGFKSLILNKDICDVDYVYYYLKHHIREIESLGSGTTFKEVSKKALQSFEFSLPELEVQLKISKLLSDIDAKITLNRSINHNLEAMAKQLYDYWFVQFDFPDENGMPYKSSGGKMVWNEKLKREIPEGWKVSQLGNICSFRNGINYAKDEVGSPYSIVNVRNISSTSIILDSEDFDVITIPSSKAQNYMLTEKDIVIARSGCPGATRLLQTPNSTLFCGFIICCTPFVGNLRIYLTFLLKSLEGSSATTSGGSILQNVSQETLKSLLVTIPPMTLLVHFDKFLNDIIEQLYSNSKTIKKLTKLRDSLLPLLMNGQVSINYDLSND